MGNIVLDVHGRHSIGERNQEGRMRLEFCDAEHLCITNMWLSKADKEKDNLWLRM